VWHVSVMPRPGHQIVIERLLEGVGDATLGEWRQAGVVAHQVSHLRRRLSTKECIEYGLAMLDLRGTQDGEKRLRWLFQQYPHLRHVARAIGEF
jgi:hypothetical protein